MKISIKDVGILLRKNFFGKVKNVRCVKGVGFKPEDNYYIDEDFYVFGHKIKSKRFWRIEDFMNRKSKKDNRVIVGGFMKKEVD